MTHPYHAHYQAKVAALKALPKSAFLVTRETGKLRSKKSEVVALYAHLARCPNRHSENQALMALGLPMCDLP